MNKKVLIISSSPRKGGNSETLADAFIRGAKEAGHQTEKICLYDKTISFCKGCLACLQYHRCVIHDDADVIAQKMRKADVLVFATPIYYYEMCGQMKTMLDRANPLYDSDYQFRDVSCISGRNREKRYGWSNKRHFRLDRMFSKLQTCRNRIWRRCRCCWRNTGQFGITRGL